MKMDFCDLSGKVVTKNNINYDELRQVLNRSIQNFPIAIVYCYNYDDVSNAIVWARKNDISLRIRSGGHNYQGFSVGNTALVIDISNINYIDINEENNYVKVGGGIKSSKIYKELSSYNYPFPGGTCPNVGVSGFITGGGWGLSSRKFGLGCDSLIEVEIINYQGRLIKSNKFVNDDLFWAIKGSGGGNYGVIVSMTFSLLPKVDKVSLFSLYYPHASRNTQFEFFNTWQNWIITASNDINMRCGIYNDLTDGIYVSALGLSYNDEITTTKNLEDFLNIKGCILNIENIPLFEALQKIQHSYPDYEYFKSAGRFVYKNYDTYEINHLLSIINDSRPYGSYLTALNMYGLGGNISKTKNNDSAYYYRNAHYILSLQTKFENNDYIISNTNWLSNHYDYLSSLTYGNYINFPYYPLKDYEKEYYGYNLDKIRKIKEKYDPYCFFNFPQSVTF